MAAILVVPGSNPVLQAAARQLAQRDDTLILESANDALWQTRRQPPQIILSHVQLRDMRGVELAEIVPNFAPSARIVVCGDDAPDTAAQVVAAGATWLPLSGSIEDDLHAIYTVLGIQPPSAPAPAATVPDAPPPIVHGRRSDTDRESPGSSHESSPSAPALTPPRQELSGQRRESSPVGQTAPPARREPAAPAAQGGVGSGFGRSDALVIQPAQHQQLGQVLRFVARETEAQCVLLVDEAGMILVQSGSLTGVIMELIAPLLATTFSATSQLARQLQEQRASAAYIHEGERFDLYAFNIDSRVSLLIIFDKRLNAGKLGTVWVYARRAMRQIQHILRG